MNVHIRTVTLAGRKVPKGVELIEVAEICGVSVPVFRGTPEHFPELTDDDGTALDGRFMHDRTCIFVRAGQSPSQERDTRVHEKVHAFVYLSGLSAVLRLAMGPQLAKRWAEIEEAMARTITPHLVGMGVR